METEIIDWDSYQFKIEALDETKVNTVNVCFNVISIQISILFATNILKMKWEAVKAVIYGCITWLDGRIPDCKLGMHAKYFHDIQKASFLIIVAGRLMETMN